jgi:hypothetical protein
MMFQSLMLAEKYLRDLQIINVLQFSTYRLLDNYSAKGSNLYLDAHTLENLEIIEVSSKDIF